MNNTTTVKSCDQGLTTVASCLSDYYAYRTYEVRPRQRYEKWWWYDPFEYAELRALFIVMVITCAALSQVVSWMAPWRLDRNIKRRWRGYQLIRKGY